MARLNFLTPLFIAADLKQSVSFYTDKLGFEIWYIGPDEDPFFAFLGRDGVSINLKVINEDVPPLPNAARHRDARWDAYINTPDPDGLFAEFQSKGVTFSQPLMNNTDNLRGFELADADGYVLFFGRPLSEDERTLPA